MGELQQATVLQTSGSAAWVSQERDSETESRGTPAGNCASGFGGSSAWVSQERHRETQRVGALQQATVLQASGSAAWVRHSG